MQNCCSVYAWVQKEDVPPSGGCTRTRGGVRRVSRIARAPQSVQKGEWRHNCRGNAAARRSAPRVLSALAPRAVGWCSTTCSEGAQKRAIARTQQRHKRRAQKVLKREQSQERNNGTNVHRWVWRMSAAGATDSGMLRYSRRCSMPCAGGVQTKRALRTRSNEAGSRRETACRCRCRCGAHRLVWRMSAAGATDSGMLRCSMPRSGSVQTKCAFRKRSN